MQFEMQILNIFNFADGRTILGGRIDGEQNLIKQCKCEIRRGGNIRQVIKVEREEIVKKTDPTNDLRALETLDEVDLSKEDAQSGDWKLISVPN
ncbi:hypothetical protein [Candidatus Thiodiazotropha sp. CDECU1]|uniref:hypothetical protein n=1 Tax=Candidatus Thiodiazotropha sp. CDECU1 TaxID=3065865 RepID=UPI00292D878A|nr:hypothetical protein [Candidatus Thiodiazotropha sp. CDECU1]